MIDPATIFPPTPLTLTHDQENKLDAQATKAIMDAYQQADGWHCPRCTQIFTDPDAFAQHIIDEANAAFAELAQRTPHLRQPTTRPTSCTRTPPQVT
ncbi:hypothetical protein ES703_117757 [subsurface metagenome]